MFTTFINNYSIEDDVLLEIVIDVARLSSQRFRDILAQLKIYNLADFDEMHTGVINKRKIANEILTCLSVNDGHKLLGFL